MIRTSWLFALSLSLLFLAAVSVAPLHAQDAEDGPSRVSGAEPTEGPGFPTTVIYTNIPGDPSSAVPGLPGVSFGPGTSTTHFDRVFGSPNGNWILTADTDLPSGADEVLLVNDVVEVIEGDPASWAPGEAVGFLETKVGVNDAGEWVFATNTDGPTGADEYMLMESGGTISVAAQEGGAIGALADAFWGSTIESGVILADGTVGLVSDSITGTGVTTSDNEILVQGTTLLGREGITVPPGQLGSEAWENFDVGDVFMSTDGSHWLAQGDLTGSTTTDDVVVVDGSVVVQEGVILAGSGFSSPVDASGIVGVGMSGDGTWFARGNNDDEQDWIYSNGALLTAGGSPITTGASELWDDTDFSDLFFLHVGNSNGDFVIGGVTDATSDANGVLVLNNDTVVVRESDPIDLDGNGMFDDDTFFDTFGNDDAHLTDAGILYIVATIKDGTGARVGQGFFSIDLTSVIPVELMTFTAE
jgi:hypothetical protein